MADAGCLTKQTTVPFSLGGDLHHLKSTRDCSSNAAALLGKRQIRLQRTFTYSRQQFQGVLPALTQRKCKGLQLQAVASTDQETNSKPAVQDPKTLKEKRKYLHYTQPWFSRETVLRKEADGIWTLTQPFQLGFGRFADARLRATVVQLEDGTLWVHSPVALTEECAELVTSLGGQVAHIVVPNTSPEHAWFSKGWADRFPDARWYAPVRIVQKLSQRLGRQVHGLEKSQVPPAWASVLQAVTFSTGANGEFQEDLFFHTREKALIVADMLVCLDDEQLPTGINKFMAQSLGVRKELGMLIPFRLYLGKYPEAAKAFCNALSKLDFSWIIFSHGSIPVRAGKDDIMRVYNTYL
ncbi:hypothetical protein KFL_000580030 [Klebsormidium nitens]|uniref:Uncharacterized protein n=1 Tax=Klebsormidium nitens TaxID=105231 RepID=A0A1Y1HTU9_KLENI|nr:hypothetical protein KFL_000580030 [Klebsormidium nitens]|eukprot:GAQ80609.1 hypothetical protein KFL_000580030 [Klebsormidium nitens]